MHPLMRYILNPAMVIQPSLGFLFHFLFLFCYNLNKLIFCIYRSMCNSAPQLLYYVYVPGLVLMLVLGFLVFLNNKKSLSNRLFFLLSINICLWVLFTMLDWQSVDPNVVEIFTKLSIIGIIAPAIFLYFSYVFPDNINLSTRKVLAIFLPIVPFILLAPTKFNIEYIDPSNSDCDSVFGLLYYLLPVVAVFYSVWSCIVLIKKFKKGDSLVKKQMKLILFGFLFLMIWAISTNVVAPMFWLEEISFLGPIGALVFILFIAYAIVKYQFLSIKVILTQALVIGMIVLVGSELLFVENTINKVLISVTLVVVTGFGYFLVRSVKLEVERKEELQLMADKLATANDQLRKLDNAKTEFISIASHQLRTPITAIKGFASLLLEGSYGEINEAAHGALEKVYTSADRLVNLIEDLLNVSRIESGRMTFAFESSSVEGMLKELYDNFILVAKNKQFYLDLKLPETPLPEVVMDYTKIRELASNFIDNALKYTEKGGVTIKAELKEEGVIVDEKGFVVPGQKSEYGQVVRVTVSDTGIGIPQEEIPYLFKKFSRGKDVSRLHVGGTGLGLYVGKAIAEAHHGQVWVESDGAGLGSRFIIEIPVVHQP